MVIEIRKKIIFNDVTEFDRAMSATINKDIYQRHQQELRHLASIGQQRFDEKFGWLGEYENDLKKYQQIVDVIKNGGENVRQIGVGFKKFGFIMHQNKHGKCMRI